MGLYPIDVHYNQAMFNHPSAAKALSGEKETISAQLIPSPAKRQSKASLCSVFFYGGRVRFSLSWIKSWNIYHLVMTNIVEAMALIEIDGSPFLKMVIFNGYVK
jgi:hypothetical protein